MSLRDDNSNLNHTLPSQGGCNGPGTDKLGKYSLIQAAAAAAAAAHKESIHECRHLLALKAFPLHHMAPVAGGIACSSEWRWDVMHPIRCDMMCCCMCCCWIHSCAARHRFGRRRTTSSWRLGRRQADAHWPASFNMFTHPRTGRWACLPSWPSQKPPLPKGTSQPAIPSKPWRRLPEHWQLGRRKHPGNRQAAATDKCWVTSSPHRIVGMLQEVGRLLLCQAVGVSGSGGVPVPPVAAV